MRLNNKRVLAAILAFTLVFTMMPSVSLTAFAEENKIVGESNGFTIKTKPVNGLTPAGDNTDEVENEEPDEEITDETEVEGIETYAVKEDERETGAPQTLEVGIPKEISEDHQGNVHEWISSDNTVVKVESEGSNGSAIITGLKPGTAIVSHRYKGTGNSGYVRKSYSVTVTGKEVVTGKVPVAVYATDGTATFASNQDVKAALGMENGYVQPDNYAPLGVIWLDASFFAGKTSPYIQSESDWNTVKGAISNIDTSYLQNSGVQNSGNKVFNYLNLAYYNQGQGAGSLSTALFDWNTGEAQNAIGLIDGKNYAYHLDIKFSTNSIRFVGVTENESDIDLGSRVYLTNTSTKVPGTSSDWYLKTENIPDDYQIIGYYGDSACQNDYSFGGTLTSNTVVYVKLDRKPISISYDLNGGTSTSFDGTTHTYEGVKIGENTPVPENVTKTNMILLGWEDEKGNSYDTIPTHATESVTYSAIWGDDKSNTFTINYYLNNSAYEIATSYVDDDKDEDNIVGAIVNAQDYAKNINGFTFVKSDANSITIKAGSDNVINFYYYKNITIDVPDKRVKYNGQKHEIAVTADTVHGTIEGFNYDFSNIKTKLVTSRETVGHDSINLKDMQGKVDNSQHYLITAYSGGNLDVEKRTIYISVNDAEKYYGEKDPSFTGVVAPANASNQTGPVEGDLQRLYLTYYRENTNEEVGKYENIIEVKSDNENYEVVITKRGTLTIKNKNDNTINFTDLDNHVYDGTNKCPTAVAGVEGSTIYYSTDGENYSKEKPSFVDAGKYTVYAYATKKGYDDTEKTTVTFTVEKRPVIITVDAARKNFGDENPAFTGKITAGSLVNANDLGVISYYRLNPAQENAGTYEKEITASYSKANENYAISIENGTFTINSLVLADENLAFIIDAGKSENVVYNGNDQKQPVVVTYGNNTLVRDRDYTLEYTSDTKNVGTVTVTVKGIGNYSGKAVKTYNITKKPVTINVNESSKVYGKADPEFTGTVTGLCGDDSLNVKYIRTGDASNVGTYPGVITATYDKNANYEVFVKPASFTITKASANSINITDYAETYDKKAHGLISATATQEGSTIEYSRTENGNFSTEPVTYTEAGTHSVWVKATNPNFEDVIKEGYVTIEPKEVTVSPDNVEITFGDKAPSNEELTGTKSGVIDGDNLGTITYSIGTHDNSVGAYDVITANVANPNSNYRIVYNTATLTIKKNANISVGEIEDVTYDGNKQEISPQVKAGDIELVAGEDYTVTYERVQATNDPNPSDDTTSAGTIKVTVTGIGNYDGTVTTTYVIMPREATITVANLSKTYGTADKDIECESSISNLVKDGDVLVTEYTFKEHSESASSQAYVDVIGCIYSENPNYNITVDAGDLTIVKATELGLVATNRTVEYSGEKYNLNGVSTSVTDGTTITYSNSEDGVFVPAESFAGFSEASDTPYTIYVKAENPNYETAVTSATLTINRKPINVVAETSTANITYGESDPTITVTVKDSNGQTIEVSGLNPNYTITGADGNAYEKNVGSYTVTPTYATLNNYEVTATNANFTVTAKEISSVDDIADVIYKGEAYPTPSVVVKAGDNTISGNNYTVTTTADTTNAGKVVVTVNGTGNYSGTIVKEFNILPRKVVLTADSDHKEYDGNPLTKDTFTIGKTDATTGLVGQDAIASATVSGSQTIVGKGVNKVSEVVFAEGTLAGNYVPEYHTGELEITSRETKYYISVTPNSGEAKYDGTLKTVSGLYSASTYTEKLGFFAKITHALGLTNQLEVVEDNGQELVFTLNGAQFTLSGLTAYGAGTEVGKYDVAISGTAKVVDVNDNDVTEQFYINTAELGTLEISDEFHRIIIHYVDSAGNKLAADYVGAFAENRNYSYVSPVVSGYTATRSTIYLLAVDKVKTDIEISVLYNALVYPGGEPTPGVDEGTPGTPGDEGTPVEPGATAGTTPAAPTSTTVVSQDNPQEPANAQGPAANGNQPAGVGEEPVRLSGRLQITDDGELQIVDITDEEVARFASEQFWALLNLICALIGILFAIYLFVLLFRKNKQDEDEKEAETVKAETDEDEEEVKKDNKLLKVLSIVTAIASVIVFMLTENMNSTMRIVDKWTVLMVVLLLVEIVFAFFSRKKSQDDDKNKDEEVEIAQ